MKRYIILYALAAFLLPAGFALSAALRDIPVRNAVDTVAVNEIVKQASVNWDDPARMDGYPFVYRFVIFDAGGSPVYSSTGNMPDNAMAAIRNGFLPASVTYDGKILGTALIETSPVDAVARAYENLSVATLLLFALMCALNIIFLTVFYRLIVRPFRRVRRFAHKISTGVFDEPLPLEKNDLFGLFTQSFDIMRESLLDARRKQFIAERSQKELIASLSHDIKTPVTSIRLISELIKATSRDPALTEKLNTIDMKANQIDRLINDMLYSSLEELGEMQVSLAGADSSVLRALLADADHLFKVRQGDIPPCLIELDITRMEQVFGNIIANSYKYAGTAIDVHYIIDGDVLRIDIGDYGDGVDSTELELVTNKFYRGISARTRQKDGEGLGLYIAKLLMVKMGGGLEAINRADGFTVRLWIRLSR
jgi:signal transduction histidine kinase